MKELNQSKFGKLDGLKAPIDKQQSWKELYNREGFPKEEKKRRVFFWLFFGLCLIGIVGSVMMITKAGDTTMASTDVSTKDSPLFEKTKVEESPKKAELTPDLLSKKLVDRTPPAQSDLARESTPIVNQEEKSKSIKISKTLKNNYSEKESIGFQNSITSPTRNNIIPSLGFTNASPKQQIIDFESKEKREPKISFLSLLLTIDPFPFQRQLLKIEMPFAQSIQPIKTQKSWSFELGLGLNYGVHDTSIDTLEDVPCFQKDNTNTIVSYMADLRINRKLKGDWRIALGLRYSNHQRKFFYHNERIEYLRQTIPDPYHYFESTISTEYTYYHKHHTLDLESILIKDFTWGRNSFYAGAGVSFNLLYNFNGKSINSSLDEFELSQIMNYKNRLGLSYLIELGLTRKLNERIYMNASVAGKSRMDLTAGKDHGLMPFYFRLGLGYKF